MVGAAGRPTRAPLYLDGYAALLEELGEWLMLVKYLGGAYLVALGVAVLRAHRRITDRSEPVPSTPGGSFLAGLLITLDDQKAVPFYPGFVPVFVDLATVSPADVGTIAAITATAVGGVNARSRRYPSHCITSQWAP